MGIQANAQLTREKADQMLREIETSYTSESGNKLDDCKQLVDFYDSINNPCQLAVASSIYCAYLISDDKLEEGLQKLIDARKLHAKGQCDDKVQIWILLVFNKFYNTIREFDKADSVTNEALNLYREEWNDDFMKMRLYTAMGDNKTKIEEGLPYFNKAVKLARKLEYYNWESKILTSMGWLYASNDSFLEARKYFTQALTYPLENNIYSTLHVLYNNLAGVQYMLTGGEDTMSLSLLDSAIYYARQVPDYLSLQTYNYNKAFYLKEGGDYKTAYGFLYDAYELNDSVLNQAKLEAIEELEQKYEAEKRTKEIQTLTLKNLSATVENYKIRRTQTRLFIGTGVLLLIASFFAYNFITARRNRNILAEKNKAISDAQQRSDELLLNILPREIADDLKIYGKSDAQLFDQASILFTDFIEFTQTTEKMETQELVEELNKYFVQFDKIVDKYQIEKIKTIGDSYMAAGGLPVAYDNTAKQTVLAALEMQQFVIEHNKERKESGKITLAMRAGIHSGPVVAGIVGEKKYQYDVWGDTVNTASRMENNGAEGKVNISKATYDLIKHDPEFTFEYRGKINAKGKGEIDMYFVQLVSA